MTERLMTHRERQAGLGKWGNDAFRMLMGLDPLKPFDSTKQYGCFAAVDSNKIEDGMQLLREQAKKYIPKCHLDKVEYIEKHSDDGSGIDRVSIGWSYIP